VTFYGFLGYTAVELLKDTKQYGGLPPYIKDEEFSSIYSSSVDPILLTDTAGCGNCQD